MGLKPILGLGDRVPSVLNGGLDKVPPLFWVAALSAASFVEISKSFNENENENNNNFIAPSKDLVLSEIKHGRLAMLAITGFAMTEFVNQMSVVNLTPFFFHPLL